MQDSSLDWDVYFKNLPVADALQEKYGLSETLKDLYAWEVLSADEVIALQKYNNEMQGREELLELDESTLRDVLAIEYYKKGFFTLGEALELQSIRTKNEI